ncbi:hypothetical protein CSUI_006409, partial [Cystoisospora suis]
MRARTGLSVPCRPSGVCQASARLSALTRISRKFLAFCILSVSFLTLYHFYIAGVYRCSSGSEDLRGSHGVCLAAAVDAIGVLDFGESARQGEVAGGQTQGRTSEAQQERFQWRKRTQHGQLSLRRIQKGQTSSWNQGKQEEESDCSFSPSGCLSLSLSPSSENPGVSESGVGTSRNRATNSPLVIVAQPQRVALVGGQRGSEIHLRLLRKPMGKVVTVHMDSVAGRTSADARGHAADAAVQGSLGAQAEEQSAHKTDCQGRHCFDQVEEKEEVQNESPGELILSALKDMDAEQWEGAHRLKPMLDVSQTGGCGLHAVSSGAAEPVVIHYLERTQLVSSATPLACPPGLKSDIRRSKLGTSGYRWRLLERSALRPGHHQKLPAFHGTESAANSRADRYAQVVICGVSAVGSLLHSFVSPISIHRQCSFNDNQQCRCRARCERSNTLYLWVSS